jgi:xylose dehydrogenase (NAD/NADP)
LLSDSAIDAVYISLPNSMHVEWAVRALEAGKHVLCEKPLGRDPAQVAHAFGVADRAGKLLAEAFMYRFHPQTAEIRRLIVDGIIGHVRHLRATLSFPMQSPLSGALVSSELQGGALMDVGCYCVSAFRLLAGEPTYTDGYAVSEGLAVDSRFLGALAAEDGTTGQFDAGITLRRRDALEIVGDKGAIFVPDPWHCRGAPFEVVVDNRHTLVRVEQLDAYRAEFETVSRAIRNGGAIEFGRNDAVAQARTLAALHASAQRKMMLGASAKTREPDIELSRRSAPSAS